MSKQKKKKRLSTYHKTLKSLTTKYPNIPIRNRISLSKYNADRIKCRIVEISKPRKSLKLLRSHKISNLSIAGRVKRRRRRKLLIQNRRIRT